MKATISVLGLLFLIVVCPLFALSVQEIDSYVQLIDSSDLESRNVDIETQSTEGGSLQIYTLSGDTVKAVRKIFGEMGQHGQVFYFRNQELMKLEIVKWKYNVPMYITVDNYESLGLNEYFSFENSKKTTDQYYFEKTRIIDLNVESDDVLSEIEILEVVEQIGFAFQ